MWLLNNSSGSNFFSFSFNVGSFSGLLEPLPSRLFRFFLSDRSIPPVPKVVAEPKVFPRGAVWSSWCNRHFYLPSTPLFGETAVELWLLLCNLFLEVLEVSLVLVRIFLTKSGWLLIKALSVLGCVGDGAWLVLEAITITITIFSVDCYVVGSWSVCVAWSLW
jgi:hypothetical protein